jgi:hypothetical protein
MKARASVRATAERAASLRRSIDWGCRPRLPTPAQTPDIVH